MDGDTHQITVRTVKLEFDAAIPTLQQAIFSLLSLLSATCRIQRAVKQKHINGL
jgi:hypothetical protein